MTDPRQERQPNAVATHTWRLVVAYHGKAFHGWQRQQGARTVQETLEAALATLSSAPVVARAAGRTDAGVHARGQVVSTTLTSRVPADKMVLALGSLLPADLSVLAADVVDASFDAKRRSIGKRYVYRVLNRPARDPFRVETSWHVRHPLDVDAMRAAAEHFLGERDFESFRSVHCDAAHARRYLWRASLDVIDELLCFEVRGNAFCRYMVRCLAGTLVDVGRGRFSPADVERILLARDRTQAGVTAPPEGLTLEEVYYPETLARAGIPPHARFPGHPPEPEGRPATSAEDPHD